jgi:hypothetical protein
VVFCEWQFCGFDDCLALGFMETAEKIDLRLKA